MELNNKIYLIQDKNNLDNLIEKCLINEGYNVITFYNISCAKNKITDMPDLWIFDVISRDIERYDLVKKIKRNNKDTPVIFMSVKDEKFNEAIGVEFNGDDYFSKPLCAEELITVTNNIMRKDYNKNIQFVEYYNKRCKIILFRGQKIILTNREVELLSYFIENKDIILKREQILMNVWGNDHFASARIVDNVVSSLRRKISKLIIKTIYGYGYKLVSIQ